MGYREILETPGNPESGGTVDHEVQGRVIVSATTHPDRGQTVRLETRYLIPPLWESLDLTEKYYLYKTAQISRLT